MRLGYSSAEELADGGREVHGYLLPCPSPHFKDWWLRWGLKLGGGLSFYLEGYINTTELGGGGV